MKSHNANPEPPWHQRSPIDLREKDAYYHNFGAFEYPKRVVEGVLIPDHGHPKLDILTDVSVTLLGKKAKLKSVHFHKDAEHYLDGHQFDSEMHLVHELENQEFGSQLFALGIFFKQADEGTSAGWGKLGEGNKFSFELSHCLPQDRSKFYRYEGSLTSGELKEVVSWLVFHEPVAVLASDLEAIRKVATQTVQPLAPLHRRYVLRSW